VSSRKITNTSVKHNSKSGADIKERVEP